MTIFSTNHLRGINNIGGRSIYCVYSRSLCWLSLLETTPVAGVLYGVVLSFMYTQRCKNISFAKSLCMVLALPDTATLAGVGRLGSIETGEIRSRHCG